VNSASNYRKNAEHLRTKGKMMKIFNTLSGQKEEFVPWGDPVTMYVCGVTPYAESHLGHAMFAVVFDVVRRYLKYRGYGVRYVRNITDIEDKIIDRANRLGVAPKELAQGFADKFFEEMAALNVDKPDVTPYATEEIPKMLELIEGLVKTGHAYAANGSVYFRVRSMTDYGKLSHRALDSMMVGARIEPGEEKEHPMDFALWKASKPGEPAWESPWGQGRPGWHIECSAMSLRYLGEQIDIHGGGQDLIFPHHENEIAQSECFTLKTPFVKYWMHNGLLQLGAEKMSKSLGNLVTIRQVLEKHSADAVRVFFLTSHYRSPITYTGEAIDAAENGVERLREVSSVVSTGTAPGQTDVAAIRARFIEAMDDDFNTPQALSAVFDLAREINRERDAGRDITAAQGLFKELTGILGLPLKAKGQELTDAAPFIELLVTTRKSLRQAKQFQLADEIRNKLTELGITLEDTTQGTVWKKK
jgi:cysteinyl-tRNA synthetase